MQLNPSNMLKVRSPASSSQPKLVSGSVSVARNLRQELFWVPGTLLQAEARRTDAPRPSLLGDRKMSTTGVCYAAW